MITKHTKNTKTSLFIFVCLVTFVPIVFTPSPLSA